MKIKNRFCETVIILAMVLTIWVATPMTLSAEESGVVERNSLTFFQWLSENTTQSEAVRNSAAVAARMLQNQMTDADRAASILNDGTVTSAYTPKNYSDIIQYTSDHIGEAGNATSWENFKYALEQFAKGNDYRSLENVNPLKVSSVMMAEAEINANYQNSGSSIQHGNDY